MATLADHPLLIPGPVQSAVVKPQLHDGRINIVPV